MQGMRDLLRGSLSRSLRELSDEDRLAAAWTVACGSALASRGEIEYLDHRNALHVAVDGAEWMHPFLSIRVALASDLSKIAAVTISEIHLKVKPFTRVRSAAVDEEPQRASGEKHERR